jgi:hypothetical protein
MRNGCRKRREDAARRPIQDDSAYNSIYARLLHEL